MNENEMIASKKLMVKNNVNHSIDPWFDEGKVDFVLLIYWETIDEPITVAYNNFNALLRMMVARSFLTDEEATLLRLQT